MNLLRNKIEKSQKIIDLFNEYFTRLSPLMGDKLTPEYEKLYDDVSEYKKLKNKLADKILKFAEELTHKIKFEEKVNGIFAL
jgi:hypothetical protein